jgi:hypothetical protein
MSMIFEIFFIIIHFSYSYFTVQSNVNKYLNNKLFRLVKIDHVRLTKKKRRQTHLH